MKSNIYILLVSILFIISSCGAIKKGGCDCPNFSSIESSVKSVDL